MNKLTPEQMVERAWDIHQIKNLISAHAYAHAYNRHDWELDELWVREPEHTETMSFLTMLATLMKNLPETVNIKTECSTPSSMHFSSPCFAIMEQMSSFRHWLKMTRTKT